MVSQKSSIIFIKVQKSCVLAEYGYIMYAEVLSRCKCFKFCTCTSNITIQLSFSAVKELMSTLHYFHKHSSRHLRVLGNDRLQLIINEI